MTSIDELIRAIHSVPEADATETADLAKVRAVLHEAIQSEAMRQPARARPERHRFAPLRFAPVLATCLVALLVGAGALVVLGRHHASGPSTTAPAPGPAARALVARLAVLRRAQTGADKLPAHLAISVTGSRAQTGTVIPSLTRLVATLPDAKLYLAVTTPAPGPRAVWSQSLGDLVTIIAVTPRGATQSPGSPAADLSDSSQLIRAGVILNQRGSGSPPAVSLSGAYDVAIVPDGVARVRWMFTSPSNGPGRVVAATVTNNVAVTRLERDTAVLRHAAWYAPDGSVFPTSDAALTQALAARQAAQERQALAQAERQHVSAPASLLAAFAVFSFNSPTGTRTPDGYVISHPPLSQLPLAVLPESPRPSALDLRQARRVVAPSGREMWVIPGQDSLCVFTIDSSTGPAAGRLGQSSAGGSCSGNLQLALAHGVGVDADNQNGAIEYGVVPKTTHSVTIRLTLHTHRTIHPADGVYIVATPFHFG